MRLSCNFVNVYTIAYRVQYTCTGLHAHIPNGHPRDDPRAEVGEDVRVGVGVRVGAVEYQLYANKKHLKNVGTIRDCEPPHAHSADVATGTVARRLRIDVHNTKSPTTTTTTTTRDRGDRYGPMEWAQ